MTQKMVVKVTSLNGDKSRSKALKIAVGFSGVQSASLKGDDKNQIEVTGDVDPVQLTRQLRKGVGHAELVSVSTEGGEKKDEKKDEKSTGAPMIWSSYPPYVVYEYPSYGYAQQHDPCPCSIM